jgi:uncharacterized protein YjhX (UPF0386 family)
MTTAFHLAGGGGLSSEIQFSTKIFQAQINLKQGSLLSGVELRVFSATIGNSDGLL